MVLVAIHYRESGFRASYYSHKQKKPIKNVGGPFMLDFGPRNNPSEFHRRVRRFERQVHKIYYGGSGPIPRSSHDFGFAVLAGAHHLKQKLRCEEWTHDCIEDALWGYNGRAQWQKSAKDSAYVWSDPKGGNRLNMKFRDNNGAFVQYQDQRPGAMLIYLELVALTSSVGWSSHAK